MKNDPSTRALFKQKVADKFGSESSRIMEHYDTLVARFGESKALDIIVDVTKKFKHQTTAAHICELNLSPTGKLIRESLQHADRSGTVETKEIVRVRSAIQRFNQAIDKAKEIGELKIANRRIKISNDEIDGLKFNLSPALSGEQTFSATASLSNGRTAKLFIEVKA
jgi:hypothetical protein